jgi:hypothetical protein
MSLGIAASSRLLTGEGQSRADCRLERVLQIIFLILLLHSVWAFTVGWDHTLLDQYGFRQAQTAITVNSIAHGGPWMHYQTPVLGPPWSIPFEFPLYQWVAALFVISLRIPVDQACRITSVVFFYFSLSSLYLFLRTLGLARLQRWPFLILAVVSPSYLFWSRAALIESCSVFLGLTYLWLSANYLNRRTRWGGVLIIVIGSLGAMVKLTTFCGFALVAAALLCRWGCAEMRNRDTFYRRILVLTTVILAAPMASGYLWTLYADAIKAQNPLAGFIVSSALNNFTIGPIGLRLSGTFWSVLWARSVPDILGSQLVPILVLAILPLVKRRRFLALASAGVFLVCFLVFANLQFVHKYYQYEIGLFLIGSVAFSIADLLCQEGRLKWSALIVLAISVVVCLHQYHVTYYQAQLADNLSLAPTARAIQSNTKPGDVLIVYGLDWSSELPYYSDRRAIMLRRNESPTDPRVRRAITNLGRQRLGAMAVCSAARMDLLDIHERANAFGLGEAPGYEDGNCALYFASLGTRKSSFSRNVRSSATPAAVIGSLDIPRQGSAINGRLEVGGWAIAEAGIAEAAVYMDGTRFGMALLGVSRPDVQKAYPNTAGSLNSGFAGNFDLASVTAGAHLVSVRLRLTNGAVQELPPAAVTVVAQ